MGDIIAVSGSIKSLEKSFLTAGDVAKAVQSKGFNEFVSVLAHSRYNVLPQNPAKAEELTEFFEKLTAGLIEEMRKNLPSDIYRYFLLRYDYHNLKLLLDKETGEEEKNYAVHSSVDYFTLRSALENNNYKDVPVYLKDVLSLISENREGEDLLLSLKRMYYKTAGTLLKSSHSEFLDRYLHLEIDFANISTLIQIRMLGENLKKGFLIDGGGIKKERFFNEDVLWGMIEKKYHNIKVPITAEDYDIARYTAMMNCVKRGRVIPYGIETVFSYFVGRQVEMDNLRRISLGKFYKIDPKVLSEWVIKPYQYSSP